jgi:hypothetical protein
MSKTFEYDVFLSYSSKDKKVSMLLPISALSRWPREKGIDYAQTPNEHDC